VEDINFFGITRIQWLKQYLVLPHGIPSADTVLRVLARIGHAKFEECFANRTRGCFKGRVQAGPVIAIDGKTVRGSAGEAGKAVHLASARAGELGLVLGQAKTAGKSNETTAVPELLTALGVKGCVVTIGAVGCQKQTAKGIIQGKGDYVLPLKENRPETYAEAAALFWGNEAGEAKYSEAAKDHGRIEKREAWLYKDISWFENREGRAGLKAFGCIRSSRTIKEVTTAECRCFLASLADTAQFARSVRAHWGVENKLHWALDAAFREDYARNRKDRSAADLAVLRKTTLNLIRLEPTEKYEKQKLSLGRKRLYASYNPDFLLKLLLNL
ncbi:MAG: ISAs1 family transposase, partial [Treponema sp.]|nr:ISAs1 family transposase [Treponema sp.]